jgi:hypothetical protein
MNTHRYLILMVFLYGFSVSQAQNFTVSGYVSDAVTGEKVPGVNVVLPALGKGSSTNAYGFFSITLPAGEHTLQFSFIGYNTQQVSVVLNKDVTLSVELKEDAQELKEVEVTATREDAVNVVQMSSNRLTAKQLKQIPVVLGEPDLLRSIQLLPGVTTVNEASSGFNVRGGSADQNLVLLDDAIVYNTSHAFGFFSVFNPDAVKEFELFKGGIAANYGGRLSSVLDVKQKEGNRKNFSGAASIGTILARVTAEGPFGKKESDGARGSYIISARRSYADLFLKAGVINNLKDATLYFYDLNVKANYKLSEKDRMYLSGYFGRDSYRYPGFFANQWGNDAATLRWNHQFSKKLFSNTTVTYSNYDYNLINYENSTGFEWNSSIENWSAKSDLTAYLRNNEFSAGQYQAVWQLGHYAHYA